MKATLEDSRVRGGLRECFVFVWQHVGLVEGSRRKGVVGGEPFEGGLTSRVRSAVFARSGESDFGGTHFAREPAPPSLFQTDFRMPPENDSIVFPGVRQPTAVGFKTTEIERLMLRTRQ